MGMKLL